MSKLKPNDLSFHRSVNLEISKINKIINIPSNKAEIIFKRKIFLDTLLSKIKEAQCDYLTKLQLFANKNKNELIREILLKLNNDLRKMKKEKENEMKILIKKKDQKKTKLNDIKRNSNILKKSKMNAEIMNNTNTFIYEESNKNIKELLKNKEHDFKIKNFLLKNKIIEIDNNIERMKFLIRYHKMPHKYKEHFIEIIYKNNINNQNITNNLHDNLINLRNLWMNISNKKSFQDSTIDAMKLKINMLKKEFEKSNKKYIKTEDIIYEEIHETEHIQENIKKNFDKNDTKNNNINNINNIDSTIENKDKDNVKIDLKDIEKLLKLKMNINVNINVNKQYINNHFNNNDTNKLNKNKTKIRKNIIKNSYGNNNNNNN